MSLAHIPNGRSGVIEQLDEAGPLARRLGDLGFVPGTRVTAVRRAPLGDPIEFELRGTRICLRADEARLVSVRLNPRDDAPAVRRTP